MSRLHTIRASVADITAQFGAAAAPDITVPEETIEGHRGLVILENNGRRLLKEITWGFPRITREMREHGDAAGRVGLVADLTNPMWEHLVVDERYRCIIPITHFANPNGDAGAKTRTWFSVKDQPIMAWAGFCRNTPEFGPVYAGMTMEANDAIPPTNDRMPVLLEPHEYEQWLQGSIQDVIRFQFRPPLAGDLMHVERTDDAWRSGKPPTDTHSQGALPLF
jgi:putative SOS response-associated peptidase YedK